VEVVRRATEAHNLHENESVFALYDPDVEMVLPTMDGRVQVFRGLEGVRTFYRDFLEALAEWSVDVEEWIDGGDDVIAVLRLSGRGRKSGAPFERREAHVWTVRNGRLWRLRTFRTREEAVDAAGLEAG
jgi:ketosteroid isomerase-like protein